MKMLLAPVAFLSAFVTVGSGAPVAGTDQTASVEQRPLVAVSHVAATRMTRIVDVDYQLSDEQRALIAFWRLKLDAERTRANSAH